LVVLSTEVQNDDDFIRLIHYRASLD
jgi:hypothetical protein